MELVIKTIAFNDALVSLVILYLTNHITSKHDDPTTTTKISNAMPTVSVKIQYLLPTMLKTKIVITTKIS